MAAAARDSNTERPELGYESMSHFVVDTDDLAVMLTNIDFCSGTHSVDQHKSKGSDSVREMKRWEEEDEHAFKIMDCFSKKLTSAEEKLWT